MLADAFPERAARDPHNRRRVAVGVAVAALHLLILFVLLHAVGVRIIPKIIQPDPVMVWFDLRPKKLPQEKKAEPQKQK